MFFSQRQTQLERHRARHDPDKAWERIRCDQIVQSVPIMKDPDKTPQPPNTLRFVCISDTHSLHRHLSPLLPKGDVLLHAGDFTDNGRPEDVKCLSDWLAGLDYKHKIVIAGNHDLTFDSDSYPRLWRRFRHPEMYNCYQTRQLLQNCTYLEDESIEIDGIVIYGSPHQPQFCDWAFNRERGEELRREWEKIPDKVHVLVTHGPPLGRGDLCTHGKRVGCEDLLHAIQKRIKPMYNVSGHIHEGYGMTTDGVTTYVNASSVNHGYDPSELNKPIVFDVPIPPREAQPKEGDEEVVVLPENAYPSASPAAAAVSAAPQALRLDIEAVSAPVSPRASRHRRRSIELGERAERLSKWEGEIRARSMELDARERRIAEGEAGLQARVHQLEEREAAHAAAAAAAAAKDGAGMCECGFAVGSLRRGGVVGDEEEGFNEDDFDYDSDRALGLELLMDEIELLDGEQTLDSVEGAASMSIPSNSSLRLERGFVVQETPPGSLRQSIDTP